MSETDSTNARQNREIINDKQGERAAYGLVAFDYNSAELNQMNVREMREIARGIGEGTVITVLGYTDRIGNNRHNSGLSQQRAEEVARKLRSQLDARGVKDVKIVTRGEGIETDRFENDLPEGRMLSRGVSITVEPEERK